MLENATKLHRVLIAREFVVLWKGIDELAQIIMTKYNQDEFLRKDHPTDLLRNSIAALPWWRQFAT